MTAEEALFRSHLNAVVFRSGSDRGRWGFPTEVPQVAWPGCLIWVEAEARFVASGRILLRFTLDGYTARAPNAVPWDIEKGHVLSAGRWPRGPGNVSKVFNPDWNSGALYCPCDRVAMAGHDDWKLTQSQWSWNSEKDITLYLEFVHRCLNPRDH